ncbi:hypothetical protein V6N11_039998 [Hibiscus sabdariffa]|uniref:Reverse transcriptase zinc-binding domain-containing protein n=1 Tax=Hibiscus sabdariffa TaxID=183260 RepID=A0ABR2RG44_9ROSI
MSSGNPGGTFNANPSVGDGRNGGDDLGAGDQPAHVPSATLPKAGEVQSVRSPRWCNVHVQGSLGAKGGASKMQEAKGSRFTTLSTESPNGVEIEDELQLVEEENGVHVSSPVGQLAAMGNAIDTPVNVGKVDEQQHKRQIAQGKRVGTVSGVGKSLAGKVVPTVDSELGEIQIGGVVSVASQETVVRASSSLNGEKHVAVRIGSEDEPRTNRSVRGRVLPASIRGSVTKTSSKNQLGVKWGSKVNLKSSKSDDRGALKLGLSSRLSSLVSDLNKAADEEEMRLAHSRVIGATDDVRIEWKTNSVFEQPAPRPLRVMDMVSVNGVWDWDLLGAMLPREKLDLIASIPPPQSGAGVDIPGWRWDDKRLFSTRSAYEFLVHDSDSGDSIIWKRIWKLEIPHRIRVFLWLTFHERLLTHAERRGEGGVDTSGVSGGSGGFFSLPFHDWLCTNMLNASFIPSDGEWVVRFAVLCWLLWKRRCRLLLDSDVGVMDDILTRGNRLVEECCRIDSVATESRLGQGMESMLFAMAPVDIVCLVEKEQRDSSPMTALPLYIEQEVIFDPGGSI